MRGTSDTSEAAPRHFVFVVFVRRAAIHQQLLLSSELRWSTALPAAFRRAIMNAISAHWLLVGHNWRTSYAGGGWRIPLSPTFSGYMGILLAARTAEYLEILANLSYI